MANGFDSTSLLEFILELEDTFDIVIPDDDLIPDNFSSISKITDYIVSLMEEWLWIIYGMLLADVIWIASIAGIYLNRKRRWILVKLRRWLTGYLLINARCCFLPEGEPLVRNDLFELISYADSKKISNIKICTNGVLIDKYIQKIVTSAITEIHISLDSLIENDKTYRGYRIERYFKILIYLSQKQETIKK